MQVKFTRSILAGAAVALGLAIATPSTAEAQMGFVVQGQYGLDYEAIGVGGGINMGLGSLTTKYGIRGEATFDYFLLEGSATGWEINANGLMDIKSVAGLYVGAGLNYAKVGWDGGDLCGGFFGDLCDASSSSIGLNALGGWNFAGSKGPFVQARLAIGGGEQIYLGGGFRF